jgi:anti-anti-sigma factor
MFHESSILARMKSPERSRPCRIAMRILVEDLADTRTVRLVGELDAFTAPEVLDALRHALVRRPTILAVDLSDVEFLGVGGLEVLLRMRRVAERGGTAFVLTGDTRPEVKRLLGIVGWGLTMLPRHISAASALGRPAARAAGGRARFSRRPRGFEPLRAVRS